jgi:hypothetical protein
MQNQYLNRALTSSTPERRKLLRQAIEAIKVMPDNKLKIYTPELQREAGTKK